MVGFFGGILKLILVVVALLSGALSIFREFQLMYRPPAVPQKSVLWGFVRIAFVISAPYLWFQAFISMKGREAELHTMEGKWAAEKTRGDALQRQLDEVPRPSPKVASAHIIILYQNRKLDGQELKVLSANSSSFILGPIEMLNDGGKQTDRTPTVRVFFSEPVNTQLGLNGWQTIESGEEGFRSAVFWSNGVRYR